MVDLATNALTTLALVASRLAVTTPGSSDDLLKGLINSASDAIEAYCNRQFHRTAGIVEKVAGYGTSRLMVSRTPVTTLTSVVLDGVTLTDIVIEDAEAGFLRRAGGFLTTAEFEGGMISAEPLPGSETLDYVVTYTGGYVTPQQEALPGTPRTLKWDIEHACIELVRAMYFEIQRDPGIASERLLSWSASYLDPRDGTGANLQTLIPAAARRFLAPYRRGA